MKRKITVFGDIAIVPLTRGFNAIIDAVDVDKVSGYNWYAHNGNGGFYAARGSNTVFLHHIIAGSGMIDHISRDTLDNRRCNLRHCTPSQNNYNSTIRKDNSSGVKGIGFRKDNSKWRVRISVEGKCICIGHFNRLEDAKEARIKASKKYHKEFARIG